MGYDEDVRRRSLLLVLLLSACSSTGPARTAQSPSDVPSPVAPPSPSASAAAVVTVAYRTELDGCRPNPWPLPEELERAGRHDEPLAPPFERDPAG